jgi:hypothetical protein
MESSNPTVHFSTINHIRNNAITDWYDAEWLTIVEAMRSQGHQITENKDVTCISPWLYKTLDQNAITRTTNDGELWTIDDKPVVARLADNVIGTDLLMFDFDATLTIEQAKYLFESYTHFGYTSFSHRSPKKDWKDCFRVMVPLSKFVSAEDLVKRRKAIYAAFLGVDISCLSLSRSLYVPSCPPDRKSIAYMWDNNGALFNVFDFAEEPVFTSPVSSAVVNRPVDKQKIIESLKHVFLGNEPEWFNVAVAFAANDFAYEDFCEVTIGHLMHEKDEKKCREKWKAATRRVRNGKTMTVGYLINLCKKHNAWSKDPSKRELESEIRALKNELQKRGEA